METVFIIISVLSIVAFIVGMFNPATVKCSSRSKVSLFYISLFFISAIIGSRLSEETANINAVSSTNEETANAEQEQTELPILDIGSVCTIPYANGNVEITFTDISINRIPNNGLNLIFTLRIKNNSNETFFISNCDWKLLDSDKIEVEESGIYEPIFSDFAPSTFFFTTVSPNIGKEEKVGYSIKKETYYLSVNGRIMAKIPLDENN